MSIAAAARVRAALEPVVSAAGFDLEDVRIRRAGKRQVLEVVVDRDGGVSLDAVAEAARACSAVLDAGDLITSAYVLEVTSPGVDRPLTEPRHWRRAVGRLVEVRRREGGPVRGRLRAADGDALVVDVDGDAQTIALPETTSGQVLVEFDRAEG